MLGALMVVMLSRWSFAWARSCLLGLDKALGTLCGCVVSGVASSAFVLFLAWDPASLPNSFCACKSLLVIPEWSWDTSPCIERTG